MLPSIFVLILPEKNTYFTFRSISATLSTNPTSFRLHNLNLFETSINECLENESALSELLTDLFYDNDVQIYTRNASITIEDVNEKAKQELDTELSVEELQILDRNKGYYRQLFYTITVKELIIRKLEFTTSRFSQLTVTIQKSYPNNNQEIELAVGLATKSIIAKYTQELPDDPKQLLQAQKWMQVYPHKASTGLSVTNTNLKVSVSSYKKDRRSQVSKANRIANYRKLSQSQLKQLFSAKMPDNLLRHEVAMFGLETIIQRPDIELLKETERYFDKAYGVASAILNIHSDLFDPLNNTIPNIYTDHSIRMDDINNFDNNFDTPPPEITNNVF